MIDLGASFLAGCLLAAGCYRSDQSFLVNWGRQTCLWVAILLAVKVFA